MKKSLMALLAVFVILTACNKNATEKPEETIAKATIEELAGGNYEYKGGTIEIEGLCDHVCAHSGKKLFLVAPNGEDRVQIFATEGVSFPKELEGSKVKVVGKLEAEKLDLAYANQMEAELNETAKTEGEEACAFEESMKKITGLKEKIQKSKNGYITKYTMTTGDYKKL